MLRIGFICLLIFLDVCHAQAQIVDHIDSSRILLDDPAYHFHYKKLIIPTVFIGYGVASLISPSLKELKDSFYAISPKVYRRLLEVDDAELAAIFKIDMNIPFVEENKLNFIGMCIGRQDYLCGQMALMRRILNYPGMKYEMNENITY